MSAEARATRRPPKPDDPAFPGLTLDDLCFHFDEGVCGEVRDATKCSRGHAIAAFASEAGCDFTDVRCVKRYVLLHSRQDVWDGPGRDRWADDQHNDYWGTKTLEQCFAEAPKEPPSDWLPDEYMACWSVTTRTDPRGRPAWMCEVKGDNLIPGSRS